MQFNNIQILPPIAQLSICRQRAAQFSAWKKVNKKAKKFSQRGEGKENCNFRDIEELKVLFVLWFVKWIDICIVQGEKRVQIKVKSMKSQKSQKIDVAAEEMAQKIKI